MHCKNLVWKVFRIAHTQRMRWSPRGLQIEFQVQNRRSSCAQALSARSARQQMLFKVVPHTHTEIGSCATHTHTNEVLPCVWHELQLPLFAFWLHCKYIFVCCLNSKSACYIYNWSICIYIFAPDKYAKFICLRVASVCCKCVSVCVCISGFLAAKDFPACASFAFLFPFFGRCMLPHLGTINICTVPFCIGWANNMLHLLQRRPPVSAPQAAPHIETWWSINKPLISPRQCN